MVLMEGFLLCLIISIHALHTECDKDEGHSDAANADISIHALHTECDLMAINHSTVISS